MPSSGINIAAVAAGASVVKLAVNWTALLEISIPLAESNPFSSSSR